MISLAFSIVTTQTNQSFAYFDTRTRLWEFALGSLLALLLPYLQFPKMVRIILGWLGVVAMLSCGVVLQVGQQFPGYMALWPTLAAACIIVAGFSGSRVGADRFLSWKPLVKLGDSSYALYLIHWPVLVTVLVATGRESAGPKAGLAIIVFSVVAAIIATRLIDTPVRKNKWFEKKRRRAVIAILTCVAVVAAPTILWQTNLRTQLTAATSQVASDNPGAVSLLPGYSSSVSSDALAIPPIASVKKDYPVFARTCSGPELEKLKPLSFACTEDGVLDGSESETVMVVGNSHAHHFSTVVRQMAVEKRWKVINVISLGCFYGSATDQNASCGKFIEQATALITATMPDRLFTQATKSRTNSPQESVVLGYEELVNNFTAKGIKVIGLRDNPRFAFDMPQCAASAGYESTDCRVELPRVMPVESPLRDFQSKNELFFPLDVTDLICPDEVCQPVVGNVFVYIDSNHISQSYWKTMHGEVSKRLSSQSNW